MTKIFRREIIQSIGWNVSSRSNLTHVNAVIGRPQRTPGMIKTSTQSGTASRLLRSPDPVSKSLDHTICTYQALFLSVARQAAVRRAHGKSDTTYDNTSNTPPICKFL